MPELKLNIKRTEDFDKIIQNSYELLNKRLQVGFFEHSRYPDGLPVAQVAAWNNYGTSRIPERPFMDIAIENIRKNIGRIVTDSINPITLEIDETSLNKIGEFMVLEIQNVIDELKEPPNAPSTLLQKQGDNPLIDTEFMINSVEHKVE